MSQKFSLVEANAESYGQPEQPPPRKIRGLFLAKNNLSAAARAKLASDIRDGRAVVTEFTDSQCAALCRTTVSSLRAVRRKSKSRVLAGNYWLTPGERAEFIRGVTEREVVPSPGAKHAGVPPLVSLVGEFATSSTHKDRASRAAAAVTQIMRSALTSWVRGEDPNLADAYAAIEQYLRDDYTDQAQQIAADRGDCS